VSAGTPVPEPGKATFSVSSWELKGNERTTGNMSEPRNCDARKGQRGFPGTQSRKIRICK
jgi:hypothetical protein